MGMLEPSVAIPRPRGRGPVEARPRQGRRACIRAAFHARVGVAPLKQYAELPGRGLIGAIPRPRGRGPVEASAGHGHVTPGLPFHARVGVAPLKPKGYAQNTAPLTAFHARVGVAPLKPQNLTDALHRNLGHSTPAWAWPR